VGFGTFVEAAYPFMFSDKLVMIGAILSAGVSGLVVGLFGVRGTAYVPSVVAPTVSNSPWGFVLSMLVALVAAFLFTTAANRLAKRRSATG
jgi:phosphotransferase system  glucose/maltose/N-acetylglucosamine-specific IIC component